MKKGEGGEIKGGGFVFKVGEIVYMLQYREKIELNHHGG